MIDCIVERRDMRDVFIRCLKFMVHPDLAASSTPASGTLPGSEPGSDEPHPEPPGPRETARTTDPVPFPGTAARRQTLSSESS